jgi:hypothetical protein
MGCVTGDYNPDKHLRLTDFVTFIYQNYRIYRFRDRSGKNDEPDGFLSLIAPTVYF